MKSHAFRISYITCLDFDMFISEDRFLLLCPKHSVCSPHHPESPSGILFSKIFIIVTYEEFFRFESKILNSYMTLMMRAGNPLHGASMIVTSRGTK